MAHVAKRTTVGFEPKYNKAGFSPNPVPYELTPNTAFSKGDLVVLTGGKVAKATSGSVTAILGVMAHSVAQAANPATGITYGLVYDNPDMVYKVSVADARDYTATGGAAGGTTVTAADGGLTTADAFNGGLLYVYEGKNKGAIRTISDYAATGNVATFTVTAPFDVQCDTTTKFIVFGAGGEANDAINVGASGLVLKDSQKVDGDAARISSAALVGPLVCVAMDPENLAMDVMIRRSCHLLG